MSILTKKLIDPTPALFGLDLSDLSVKVLQMNSGRKHNTVHGYAVIPLPVGVIVDGVIMKPDAVVEAITAARKKANITSVDVICSLPETKAFLRIIKIPLMGADEISGAVKWEMEANIPMEIAQVYYDWQILDDSLGHEDNKISVLVVAVARDIVDRFTDVLHAAGLTVRGLEVESMAQARSLISTDVQNTTMIVDIGDRRTGFLIVVDGVPVFTSSIPLSSEGMTDAISKGLGVAPEEAESIKISHGIGSIVKNDHIFNALQPILENFVVEIERSKEFYISGLRYSKSIDHIVLCGGGARTKGIVPYLSRRLQQDVELGNPWINAQLKNIPPIARDNAVQYATTIGLALKEVS